MFPGDVSCAGGQDHPSDDGYEISAPVSLKRCSIEMKLIVPNGETPNAYPITIQAIHDAVRKALAWNHALVTGDDSSMTAPARKENATQLYIGHLIRLAFLTPDTIEVVMRGDVPAELSLGRLKKDFLLDRVGQRKALWFST